MVSLYTLSSSICIISLLLYWSLDTFLKHLSDNMILICDSCAWIRGNRVYFNEIGKNNFDFMCDLSCRCVMLFNWHILMWHYRMTKLNWAFHFLLFLRSSWSGHVRCSIMRNLQIQFFVKFNECLVLPHYKRLKILDNKAQLSH